MNKTQFIKLKVSFVLKANNQSLEFSSLKVAKTYRRRFCKLFPDVEVVLYKVIVYSENIEK